MDLEDPVVLAADSDLGAGGRGRPPEEGPGGSRGGDATANVDRLMQFDKNKDGKLSKDELSERMQGLIGRADKNNDGVATREELQAMVSQGMVGEGGRGGFGRGGDQGRGLGGPGPGPRGPGPRGPGGGGPEGRRGGGDPSEFFARMFDDRDANKDGKLSADEMPEQMKGRMEQLDTDKDGSVSREEMQAMMSRMQRGGGRDAGRGGPEGGGRPGGDRPRRPEAE